MSKTINSNVPVIDDEVFIEMREMLDDEFDELLEEFKSDTEKMLIDMASAASVGDLEQLTMLSHTLGSSSGHLGFPMLSQVSRLIEEKARNDEGKDEEYLSLIDELKVHYQNVLTALNQ